MGKAAKQRKLKRMKYLAKVAQGNSDLFEKEWERRVLSWMIKIKRDSGKLKDKNNMIVAPIFDLVDEAMNILRYCGADVFKRYSDRTYDVLTTECCKHFASTIDKRLFRLHHGLKKNS